MNMRSEKTTPSKVPTRKRSRGPDTTAAARKARFTAEMMYGGKEIHPDNQTHWRVDMYVNRETKEALDVMKASREVKANAYMKALLTPRAKADSDFMIGCLEDPLEDLRFNLRDMRVLDPHYTYTRQLVKDLSGLLADSKTGASAQLTEIQYLLESFLGHTAAKLIDGFEEAVNKNISALTLG